MRFSSCTSSRARASKDSAPRSPSCPAIVGYVRGSVTVSGRAGHAGTTPMAGREDALVAAAARVLAIRDAALSIPEAVATVGRLTVEPGGINVIPAAVTFTVDARAPDAERLDRLVEALGVEPTLRVEPVAMDAEVCEAVRAAIVSLRLPADRAPLGCRARRGDPRRGGSSERDALRPEPERRRQPLARRALLGRGRALGSRRVGASSPQPRNAELMPPTRIELVHAV